MNKASNKKVDKKMKNNRGLNFPKIAKMDVSNLWKWLKGIWSSFSRFIKRSLNPNKGNRVNPNTQSNIVNLSPLVGISQFRHPESMTVGDLMAKVQWRTPPAKVSKTATSASVSSVKDEIDWD